MIMPYSSFFQLQPMVAKPNIPPNTNTEFIGFRGSLSEASGTTVCAGDADNTGRCTDFYTADPLAITLGSHDVPALASIMCDPLNISLLFACRL